MDRHYPHIYWEMDQEHRHRAAEYCPMQKGWFQDGRRLRHVKPSKAFVWPKDGRKNTAWGRFTDILKDRGPDIHLTVNAEKHDYMYNRPTKAQWSKHTNLDDRGLLSATFGSSKHAPWTRIGMLGGRFTGKSYDFRTRQFGIPDRKTWTDAVWQPDPRKNKDSPYPEAIRDIHGRWFQDAHYLPWELGGPVSNEQGKGWPEYRRQPLRKYWIP